MSSADKRFIMCAVYVRSVVVEVLRRGRGGRARKQKSSGADCLRRMCRVGCERWGGRTCGSRFPMAADAGFALSRLSQAVTCCYSVPCAAVAAARTEVEDISAAPFDPARNSRAQSYIRAGLLTRSPPCAFPTDGSVASCTTLPPQRRNSSGFTPDSLLTPSFGRRLERCKGISFPRNSNIFLRFRAPGLVACVGSRIYGKVRCVAVTAVRGVLCAFAPPMAGVSNNIYNFASYNAFIRRCRHAAADAEA